MAVSNTHACFEELIGRSIIGVLFNALPVHRHDLSAGNKTLVFDDGTGLTISSSGSYWRESSADVARAVRYEQQRLERRRADIEGVLALVGNPAIIASTPGGAVETP